MRILILVFLVVLLAGCSDSPEKPSRQSVLEKRAARIAKAEATVRITPTPRTYRFDGSELKVFDVPVRDSRGFVEAQRCFLWRDAEYRTSTLSCPAEQQEPEVLAPTSSYAGGPSEP